MMHLAFYDKRKREWEMFVDRSYYDMTCVRVVGETNLNSALAFHFDTWKIAEQFAELIKISS